MYQLGLGLIVCAGKHKTNLVCAREKSVSAMKVKPRGGRSKAGNDSPVTSRDSAFFFLVP